MCEIGLLALSEDEIDQFLGGGRVGVEHLEVDDPRDLDGHVGGDVLPGVEIVEVVVILDPPQVGIEPVARSDLLG
jgi:hypothetical protein